MPMGPWRPCPFEYNSHVSSTLDVNLFMMKTFLLFSLKDSGYPGTPMATEAALSLSLIKLIQPTLRAHVEKLSMTANIWAGNCVFN